MIRLPRLITPAMLAALLAGCASSDQLTKNQPHWWNDPQRHGSEYLFFKALGESRTSLEEARQEAMRSVQQQIAAYILAEVSVNPEATSHASDIQKTISLSEVSTMGHPHDAKIGNRWVVWLLGSYPVSKYEEIRRRVTLGEELDRDWRDAQSLINRQRYETAEPLLNEIIETYSQAMHPPFDLEEVKLALARTSINLGLNLKARQWALDVQASSQNPSWRQEAVTLLRDLPPPTVKDAFEDRRVSVVFYRGNGSGIVQDSQLASLLHSRLAGIGVKTAAPPDVTPTALALLDDHGLEVISASAHGSGIDLVLVLELTVDTEKTGKTQTLFGATQEVRDSRINYWVIRTDSGKVLAADQTVGYSSRPEEMLHVITAHRRHLPHHAAAIVDSFAD